MPKQVRSPNEPSQDESAALRMTCESLNPTGSNKKTRISRKENEDILKKLEVSSNLFVWFKKIPPKYKSEAAPWHFRIWKRKIPTLKNLTMRRKRKQRTKRKNLRRKNTMKRILKRFKKMSWMYQLCHTKVIVSFLGRKTTTLTVISTMGKTLQQAAMTIWTVKRPTEPVGFLSG